VVGFSLLSVIADPRRASTVNHPPSLNLLNFSTFGNGMTQRSKTVPYKNICDAVFKTELLPAVYRWISGLSHEGRVRFHAIFPILAKDEESEAGQTRNWVCDRLQPSKYTMPEWNTFAPVTDSPRRQITTETMRRRPTTSHLAYGAFDAEQSRCAQAVPTRTRRDEQSQINLAERSAQYMEQWAERALNTTYRHDYGHCGFDRTVRNRTAEQTVVVYSKNVLNAAAARRAERYIDRDPAWTRSFREMCRSFRGAIEATAYQEAHTAVKSAPGERPAHPRWRDPEPVSRGLPRPAESYWSTTSRRDLQPLQRAEDTVGYDDQHRARYSKPFDQHPMTDKPSTTFRRDFKDHMANKEEEPWYWRDIAVRIPKGTAPAGVILGDGPQS
jgi:hypothetical protein